MDDDSTVTLTDAADELLSTRETMEYAGRSRKTIQRWVAAGRLSPAKKLHGRNGDLLFRRSDLDALLDNGTEDGAA